ncbi:hypothetical protein, partial [Burkholderia multivorans]|uniref:hypothetical protein n=1 Tax=Burkholderia multivorans TaxID=87883 RepID=UPI001E650FD3
RPLDPLFHLPPLRLGEKVSTYFRTGHPETKKPTHRVGFFASNRGRLPPRTKPSNIQPIPDKAKHGRSGNKA